MPRCEACEFWTCDETNTENGYECSDLYCAAGVPEEKLVTFQPSAGFEYPEPGCRYHHATLQRMRDKLESDYADYLGKMGMEMGFAMDVEERPEVKEHCIALMEHTLGMDNAATYKRWGKEFYKPYRNYYCGTKKDLDTLAFYGLATVTKETMYGKTYAITAAGREWLGKQIGVTIWERE